MEKITLGLGIKKIVEDVKKWAYANKSECVLLVSIVILGAFFRLYRISEYMTFLGDEGRDAIIVRNLLVYADPILIGPGTSIGNMYLGPLYYYLIAPFLFLFTMSPVGPSIMVAVLGIATVFLVWWVSREWFGKRAAFVSSFLYAIAPVVIIYNRSSWNPNIMPFFSLLSVFAVWKIWKKHSWKWFPVLGISYAFVLQSHYLGLLLAPVLGLMLLLTFFEMRVGKHTDDTKKGFMKYALISFAIFSFLMSPLLIFDARHEWRNTNAIKIFFTERQTTVSARPWNSLPKLWPLWEKISTRLLTGTDQAFGSSFAYAIAGGVLLWLGRSRKALKEILVSPYFVLFVWLGVAFIGLGNYKQEIYDHYYGFFFTAPFLLLGGLVEEAFRSNKKWRRVFISASVVAVIALTYINLKNTPLQYAPNRQLQRSVSVAEKIMVEGNGEPLNFAVIAERNYEGAYQYFLEKENYPVKKIDPLDTANTITEQLFVVCELPKEKCDPTHNPKSEVANFGWSKIEKEWELEGVTLYKLTHTEL